MTATILTYHSENIAGNKTSNNDHVALAADLEALHAAGCRFVSLDALVKHLFGDVSPESDSALVCLTFDDGCDYDVRALEFPPHGLQPGLLNVMEDFVRRHGSAAQPGLHATSFVIASPEARSLIDHNSLFGFGHMSDDWWQEADRHPLFEIGNHSWDHNHPDLAAVDYPRGGFAQVSSYEHCRQQVVQAGEFIAGKTGRHPRFFAYPFGESSAYLREEYFPSRSDEHGCLAALGTDPGSLTGQSNRWNLPRYVCGRDWANPAELLTILGLRDSADGLKS